MSWWDNAVSLHRDNNMVPIVTWREMKAEMRHCFVLPNYTWSLYDKLTNLKQGLIVLSGDGADYAVHEGVQTSGADYVTISFWTYISALPHCSPSSVQ
jgi:hypothetical protein